MLGIKIFVLVQTFRPFAASRNFCHPFLVWRKLGVFILWRSSSESFQADWTSFSPWDSVLVLYVQYLCLGAVDSLLLLLGIVVKSHHSSTTISNGIFEICLSFERWGLSKTFSKLTDSTSRLQLLVSSELERKYGLKNIDLSNQALTEN